MEDHYDRLTTEAVNTESLRIDECTTEEMLRIINEQDQLVPLAVKREIPNIAKAVDLLYSRLRKGGRMVYVGAGTSGRLGVLDASECTPTYGTPPEMVQAYIAGGDAALRNAVECYEDNSDAGMELVKQIGLGENDVLIGITASGSTPFVLGAVKQAREQGAAVIGVANNAGSALAALCDITIAPVVGPEVIRGSTRMKSGTAQKLVLNMLTTATMICLGKVYGNLMVDLSVSNRKLYRRAIRIIQEVTGVDAESASSMLEKADLDVKLAILMIKSGFGKADAAELLKKCDGRLKKAINMSMQV